MQWLSSVARRCSVPLARRRISYHYCTTLLGLAKFSRNLPGRYRIPAGDAGMPSGVDDIMPIWLLLGLAIVAEVVGTSLLKLSEGFSRPGPTLGTLACYGRSEERRVERVAEQQDGRAAEY